MANGFNIYTDKEYQLIIKTYKYSFLIQKYPVIYTGHYIE